MTEDTRIQGREGPRNFLKSVDEGIKLKGYEFAASFFALWKSLKMYGEENDAVKKSVDKTMELLQFFFRSTPTVNFGYNGTDIVINEQRLKGKRGGEDYLEMLSQIFLSLYIGDVEIGSAIQRQDLINFCLLTRNITPGTPGTEEHFQKLESELTARAPNIRITMFNPILDELPPIIDKQQKARQVYRNLVMDFPQFRKKVLQKQPIPLKKAIRNIQNLIDLMTDEEEDSQWGHLLFLASLDSYQKLYIPTHAANTAVLAVAVAVRLGVPKRRLTTAGLAGYLHDIGLPDEDPRDLKNLHNEIGFGFLSHLNSLNFSMMEAAITASSHHDTYDFRGLIHEPEGETYSTPISEIIKVCDYYDIATRWWPWNPGKPLSRVNAMEWIFDTTNKKKTFTPSATKGLYSVLGLYPPGQILRVNQKRSLACSVGGFFSKYEEARVIILSDQMDFKGYAKLNAGALSHLPAEQHYRLPPRAYKDIFQSFQVTV
ncbi:MAG TPA: HD domain-containing protein [bacterium]|nr:HD domain-containing protein [bacterium]